MNPHPCFFCRRSGHSKTSREHVWPQWIGRVLGFDGRVTTHERGIGPGEVPIRRDWSAIGPTAMMVGGVCKKCNEGWMSTLENATRPILAPHIQSCSAQVRLSEHDRRTIAAWVTKTSMVIDAKIHGDGLFFLPSTRLSFLETGEVPGYFSRFWLAKRTGAIPGPLTWYSKFASPLGPLDKPEHCQLAVTFCITLAFGHLVLQTWILRVQGSVSEGLLLPVANPALSCELIPHLGGELTWLPEAELDDSTIEAYHRRLVPPEDVLEQMRIVHELLASKFA